MTFGHPYLLLGLLAVPLAAIGYRVLDVRRARRTVAWSRPAMLPNIVRRPPHRLGSLPAVLFLLGLAFLLVGFARPQKRLHTSTSNAPTIVLAFDTSGSMAATDVAPTRLRAARSLAIQFLDELPSTYRVAVVAFADQVRLLVAPTFDHKLVISKLPTEVTPLGATAIGDGINYAVATAAAAAGQNNPVGVYRPGSVLVFSDGAQTAAGTTPAEAAVSALIDYVPVDTVAFGTPKGLVTQPATVNGVKTTTEIPVPVEPTNLKLVSKQAHGMFFDGAAVAKSPALLKGVYANLRTYTTPGRSTRDLSAITAGAALVLVLAAMGLSGLWYGRVA